MVRSAVALLLFGLAAVGVACGGGGSGPSPTPDTTLTPRPTETAAPTETPGARAEPPARDFVDLARRYRGLTGDVPMAARSEPYNYAVGDSETFNIFDLDRPAIIQVKADLRLITDHGYFFVAPGKSVSHATLERIGDDFESIVYPAVHAKYGEEWSPGTDADVHVSIVHVDLKGAAGYFNAGDEHPRAVVPDSNEREAVYLYADALDHPGVEYNALLAHEFQHLVHWHADADEDSWVNEGLSQTAAEEVGGGSDWLDVFLKDPDIQLNTWTEIEDSTPHYAASELFFSYILDHYAADRDARELVSEPGDSIAGVDAYLGRHGSTFLGAFKDWVVANYLDAATGPYSHPSQDVRGIAASHIDKPGSDSGSVSQFGADYYKVDAGNTVQFEFNGDDKVTIGVPEQDGAFWWSDRGDEIDSTLTRELDLTAVDSATLRFKAWYDVEKGWDYAYVAASTDGGRTWTALPGTSTTTDDPVEAAYGPGYSGQSEGWQDEQVDLSDYAGRKMLLRFETVTDDSTNLTGFAVDDIEVPQIGFRDGADADNRWDSAGFRRSDGVMAQQFIVQVIRDNDPEQVSTLELDGNNEGRITMAGPATIVVSGSTLDTAEKAGYAWTVRATGA